MQNNVLISEDGTAMLTDFDDAELGERSLVFMTTGRLAISLRWAAPELVLGKLSRKTYESDVYSLGMEVFTSKLPWAHIRGEVMIYRSLLQKEIPPRPSEIFMDDMWGLLRRCWRNEPRTRPKSGYIVDKMKTMWVDGLEQREVASENESAMNLSPPPSLEDYDSESLSASGSLSSALSREASIQSSLSGLYSSLSSASYSTSQLSVSISSISDVASSVPEHEHELLLEETSSEFRFTEDSSEPEIPSHVGAVTISRSTPLDDVVSHLTARGCQNLSNNLDEQAFSALPSRYGGSGDVYRGRLLDSTIICVKVPRISEDVIRSAKNQVHASREIHTWNKCNHLNILPLLGIALFRNRIAVVSPWIRNGTLREFLEKNNDTDRCRLSTQICDGVAYLHSINIIHSDLKGDNVLISDGGNALLTDFGSADLKNRTLTFTQLMDQSGWTMRWGAPELLREIVLPSKESDVYALGMTILEAITGQVPFADKQEMAVMLSVCFKQETPTRPTAQIPVDGGHGDMLWGLLCKCWSSKSEERPSAAEVGSIMATIAKKGLIPPNAY